MHANARLTPQGRLTLVTRIESGRAVAHVAAEMGISRPTAHKWWNRWRDEGIDGLADRSSRPHSCPHQTSAEAESQVLELRRTLKRGPARLAPVVGLPASTVYAILRRHGMNRLAWMDRPTGQVIRRIHTDRPGELVHVDVKKLGRIPDGGGWRVHGREATRKGREERSRGVAKVHSAIDAYSRLAYSEIHDDEKGATCAGFWIRAQAFFDSYGITTIDAVLTDNAKNYTSKDFTAALDGIKHRRIRPWRPQTNGKVERFNRTLLEEWAYARPYFSDEERTAALDNFLHIYNHHRHHTAIDGPPVSRVNNLPAHYI
ncbi:MAG: IS481 family transposase [Gemmatimonadetes bacterium]|nr:IS481 family transposase [Gemmatimonadota bacterium]